MMKLGCIFQHFRIGAQIYLGVLVVLVSACRTTKEVRWTATDSVRIVREIERDTMVVVTADSSWLKAWLECDSTGQVIMKELIAYQAGKYVRIPEVKMNGNLLTAKVVVDSFGIFLKLKDKYEMMTTTRIETVETLKEVNRLKGWQKICIGFGIIFLIQLVICLKRMV